MTHFSVGKALAEIAIREAGRAAEAMSSPTAAHSYSVARAQEERDRQAAAKEAAAIAKLEAKYQARRLAKKAAESAPSGKGWFVIREPEVSHAFLEDLAKRIWYRTMCGASWPRGWRAMWADLRGLRNFAQIIRGEVVLGLCVDDARLILLDQTENRKRPLREVARTVAHELAHVVHPTGPAHGPEHAFTLDRMIEAVFPESNAPAAVHPHPEPRKGALINGRPAPWSGGDGWEYRG